MSQGGFRCNASVARMAGAMMLVTLFSCSGPGDAPTPGAIGDYRSATDHHKVQVGAEQAALVVQRGGKLLGDYGAFKVMEVDDAALAALSNVPSARPRDR